MGRRDGRRGWRAAGTALLAAALSTACDSFGPGLTFSGEPMLRTHVCSWVPEPRPAGPPERLDVLEPAVTMLEPFLSHDGLTLYFTGLPRPGNLDYLRARRPALEAPFGAPEFWVETSSDEEDTRYEETADGLEAVIASSRPGGTGLHDLFHARRASRGEAWGFLPLAALNTAGDDYDPHFAEDALALYFATEARPGRGGQDIWVARRGSRVEDFDEPANVGELNTAGNESNAVLTEDGLLVVYAASEPGSELRHLRYAVRWRRDMPFGPSRPVPGIEVSGSVFEPFVRADGCELFFLVESEGSGFGYRMSFER